MQLHPQEHTQSLTGAHAHGKHIAPPQSLIVAGMKGLQDPILIGLGTATGQHGRPSPTLRLTPFVYEP